ncbi:DUF7504 family protein [Halobellus sp. GM3]|uniref:DUF7504 family protein n=1 Tax=Halobellus sp. GM3 TaxID=3458410 RepID=UPI00403E1698
MSSIERVAAQVDTADAVLVLRPQSASLTDAECKRLLLEDPAEAQILGISFSQSPSGWYDGWREALGDDPAEAALITTPDLADADPADEDRSFSVETVATPSNLTGIGVKSTPYLNEWDNAVVVADSLTMLLQYTDPQSVYRFLHVLTTRLRTTGAAGQFYCDPTVQDDQTVELLKTLFDGIIECEDGDDGWVAHLRSQ